MPLSGAASVTDLAMFVQKHVVGNVNKEHIFSLQLLRMPLSGAAGVSDLTIFVQKPVVGNVNKEHIFFLTTSENTSEWGRRRVRFDDFRSKTCCW